MRKKNKALDTQSVVFKRQYGVNPATFDKMQLILQTAYDVLHQKGGKPPKLTVNDKLCINPEISAGVSDDGQYCGGIRCL